MKPASRDLRDESETDNYKCCVTRRENSGDYKRLRGMPSSLLNHYNALNGSKLLAWAIEFRAASLRVGIRNKPRIRQRRSSPATYGFSESTQAKLPGAHRTNRTACPTR